MKYLILFIIFITVLGACSNSKMPPVKYMSDQSDLSLANYDSVEYYKADKSIWNFPARDPFVAILHFDDQHYRQILHQVKQDTSYHSYHDKGEIMETYSFYFKKYLPTLPKCSMEKTMYRYDHYYMNLDFIIVFCNRIYYEHIISGPFD